MNVQEINRAIIAGNLTNDELNSIADAVRFARNQIVHKNTGSMVVGTAVKFTNNRTGKVVVGTVEKVNRKYIMVRENRTQGSLFSTQWRVPASMLTTA